MPTEDGGKILTKIKQLFMEGQSNETQMVDAAHVKAGQAGLVKVERASTAGKNWYSLPKANTEGPL